MAVVEIMVYQLMAHNQALVLWNTTTPAERLLAWQWHEGRAVFADAVRSGVGGGPGQSTHKANGRR